MKVLISAAETSSDAHGAELLRAIRASVPEVEAFGVGGPKLQAAGLRAIVDARELLSMGFFEIFGKLPRIFSALKQLEKAAESEKPDVAVVIDYPDFHFRLAERLKAQGIPVVYYIPPKVWAWRKRRVRVLRQRFAKVLSILPFEVEFYEREKIPVKYVGNPLADELPVALTRAEARSRLGLDDRDPVLVVMPGSRPSELKHHIELMLDGVALAVQRMEGGVLAERGLTVLLPFPVTADLPEVESRVRAWQARQPAGLKLELRVSQGNAAECMVAADAGLIKSGTSTLEAAVLRCPHAIVYRPNRVSEWIFKHLIRYRGPVGLSNLVAGWSEGRPFLVNEILCSDATPAALASETVTLLTDARRREALARGLELVRARILGSDDGASPGSHAGPSALAAREVIEVARGSVAGS